MTIWTSLESMLGTMSSPSAPSAWCYWFLTAPVVLIMATSLCCWFPTTLSLDCPAWLQALWSHYHQAIAVTKRQNCSRTCVMGSSRPLVESSFALQTTLCRHLECRPVFISPMTWQTSLSYCETSCRLLPKASLTTPAERVAYPVPGPSSETRKNIGTSCWSRPGLYPQSSSSPGGPAGRLPSAVASVSSKKKRKNSRTKARSMSTPRLRSCLPRGSSGS
ncbi:hypothetical protein V5799_033926 [Amblyomma americanum]|uniref:Uncharacterized protein n=1 Tax=Amblyomma americanum TaxID=6943 RepID=A0AAQ4DLX5_AMBAM